jgi:transketolase
MSVSAVPPVLHTIEQTSINTIRTLSMDAVQAANSGHPGSPMALAPVAYCLWQQFLRLDPQDPVWPNRDRFVLSNGHASMLLYSLLHLTEVRAVSQDYETLSEVSVPLDAIKAFRQLGSRIRSTAGPRAWRLPRGRSAKASPRASALPWPGSGWPRATTAQACPCLPE